MRLVGELEVLQEWSALNVAPGGGRTERISVPLMRAEAEFAESDLEGVLVFADLQCYEDEPAAVRELMGYAVCHEVAGLSQAGLIPPASRLGVCICGDLYTGRNLLKRGETGDVEGIWEVFAEEFRWVAGVAGNHDLFEGEARFPNRFHAADNIYPLDGECVVLDGLRIGGISGIPGNLRRPWRYDSGLLRQKMAAVTRSRCDVLLLHAGPEGTERGQRGNGEVNMLLSTAKEHPALSFFGHVHWQNPVCRGGGEIEGAAPSKNGAPAFVNVDGRVLLVTRKGSDD